MNIISTFCCADMTAHLETYFEEKHKELEPPESNVFTDVVIKYISAFDEYGLPVHDGGTSFILIQFCPWCGKKLPESKRGEH